MRLRAAPQARASHCLLFGNMTRPRRRFRNLFFAALLAILAAIIVVDQWVVRSTRTSLFSSTDDIPARKVGLLLGTSKYVAGGHINLYYRYRIEAAAALYKAGKLEYILVSGDNSRKEYNEPEAMRGDLIAAGIPAERIFLDYAGFRTLDSIVRCKEVFGETKITIISQAFHNQRAVFLAQRKGVDAVAFNARDVSREYGFKVQLREKAARVKMVLDLVFGKGAKFGGERVRIE